MKRGVSSAVVFEDTEREDNPGGEGDTTEVLAHRAKVAAAGLSAILGPPVRQFLSAWPAVLLAITLGAMAWTRAAQGNAQLGTCSR